MSDDDLMTEEEQEAWWAERAEKKLAHLNTLDQGTKDTAMACVRRVRNALHEDRTIRELAVPWAEFDAWDAFCAPWERWMDIPLANRGYQNILCQGVPIYKEVDDG